MRQSDCFFGRELDCQRGRMSGGAPAPFMFEPELRVTAVPDSPVHIFVDGAATTGNVFLTVRR